MNTQNNTQNELSTVERILAPTPVYFRAIQLAAVVLAALGGLIYQLAPQLQRLGTDLPEWMTLLADKATLAVEIALIIFPQLTVDFKALEAKKILDKITK